MSTPQQNRDQPRRSSIPRSLTQPDLSRDVPPSTASNASRSDSEEQIVYDKVFLAAQLATDPDKMPQYTSRDVGDPTQIKKNKQSMADLKLRRLTELNNRLREDLERERIPVSQASKR